MEHRISQIERVTKETQIRIRLDLDGSGQAKYTYRDRIF